MEPDENLAAYIEVAGCTPEPGTRTFISEGTDAQFRGWFEQLEFAFGKMLIPYDWVAQYVGVTRAAVNKRATKGQITVFTFRLSEYVISVFGGVRDRFRREFKLVPYSEIKAWRDQIDAELDRRERICHQEILESSRKERKKKKDSQ